MVEKYFQLLVLIKELCRGMFRLLQEKFYVLWYFICCFLLSVIQVVVFLLRVVANVYLHASSVSGYM